MLSRLVKMTSKFKTQNRQKENRYKDRYKNRYKENTERVVLQKNR